MAPAVAARAVRVEGLTKFQRDLRRASPELAGEFRKSLRTIAQDVAEEAGRLAPHGRTGELAASFRGTASGTRGVVRNRQFYARFIEFGSHPRGSSTYIPGRDIVGRAVERRQEDIERGLEQAVDDTARQLGWR